VACIILKCLRTRCGLRDIGREKDLVLVTLSITTSVLRLLCVSLDNCGAIRQAKEASRRVDIKDIFNRKEL
jgi:hypothetical protein